MPLQMRLPKRGFKNPNRVEYRIINIAGLQSIVDKHGLDKLDFATLVENKFAKKNDKIKILGNGDISAAVNIEAHACSVKAKEAIEANGGSVTLI